MIALAAVALLGGWLLLDVLAGVVVGRVISGADAVECGGIPVPRRATRAEWLTPVGAVSAGTASRRPPAW